MSVELLTAEQALGMLGDYRWTTPTRKALEAIAEGRAVVVPAEPTMGMHDDFNAAVANSSDPWFGGWADGYKAAIKGAK